LEHFANLDAAVQEIGRVTMPGGSLFIAVPDASTVSDILYRWLSRGGGHVNAFVTPQQLAELIKTRTGLPLQSTRILHTGLSFLNRKNNEKLPRRTTLIGGGYEITLQVATYLFRMIDRRFRTRLSVYGWAYYFGNLPIPAACSFSNVCVRCGAGHDGSWLQNSGLISRILFWKRYRCPHCRTWNLYTSDVRANPGTGN
jgi:hypothetical protein